MLTKDGAERLVGWVGSQLPHADRVEIEGLDRVDFGHSAEMMVFTIAADGERRDVVLRLRPEPPALLEPYDLARQFAIMRALEETAVRAPRVLWLEESGDILGRPFLVMERVAGDVYEMQTPDVPDASIRRMCEEMADQLAAIHNVDLGATGLDELDDGRSHLRRELDHWADEMHRVARGALPAMEKLLATLRATMPEQSSKVTLVHGDAKPGNFAFRDDEVSAVFDWEMTTVGDPLVDIGWMEMLWMQPVGITSHTAACTFDEFLARYEQQSGITSQNRPWYRAFNAYKMAVICLIGAMMFDDGRSDDMKLVTAAGGVEILTIVGLMDLGVTEQFETGPIAISEARIREVQSKTRVEE